MGYRFVDSLDFDSTTYPDGGGTGSTMHQFSSAGTTDTLWLDVFYTGIRNSADDGECWLYVATTNSTGSFGGWGHSTFDVTNVVQRAGGSGTFGSGNGAYGAMNFVSFIGNGGMGNAAGETLDGWMRIFRPQSTSRKNSLFHSAYESFAGDLNHSHGGSNGYGVTTELPIRVLAAGINNSTFLAGKAYLWAMDQD